MGVLLVFLHHHSRRAYLEIRHACLHTAYHCGNGAGVSRQVLGRRYRHRAFRRTSDSVEPLADDVLLPLRDALYGNSVRREGMEGKGFPPLPEGNGRAGVGGVCWRYASICRTFITPTNTVRRACVARASW